MRKSKGPRTVRQRRLRCSAAQSRGCIRFDYFHARKELLRRRIKRQVTRRWKKQKENEKREKEGEKGTEGAFKSPVSKAERSQRRRSCASTRESARADKMSSRRGSERCHHRVILQQIGLHSIRWREATYEAIQPRIAAG